jgi:hypothetical protein
MIKFNVLLFTTPCSDNATPSSSSFPSKMSRNPNPFLSTSPDPPGDEGGEIMLRSWRNFNFIAAPVNKHVPESFMVTTTGVA